MNWHSQSTECENECHCSVEHKRIYFEEFGELNQLLAATDFHSVWKNPMEVNGYQQQSGLPTFL